MKNMRLIIFSILLTGFFHLPPLPAHAQVVLDGTMGTDGALHGPDYQVRAEYGCQAGANLFHSFQTFNVNTNERATFSGPNSVQNIISRVTGGTSSWIDGTLRSTIDGANMYLLNPAGMMFGPNASLDITGSFHVSTVDYLRLGGSHRFYASPRAGEVLSTAAPTAFGFLDDDAAGITFNGTEIAQEDWDGTTRGLTVPEGETISVIGGDVEMNGSYYKVYQDEEKTVSRETRLGTLDAPGGRVNIAASGSEGEAIPTDGGLEVTWKKPGNIRLNHARISVSGEGSGDVFIRGGTFLMADSGIQAETEGLRDGGGIDVGADSLSMERSDIFSNTWSEGGGGSISLKVTESVDISDFSRIFADAAGETEDAGDAGTVLIETERLSMSGGGAISSDTYGGGKGGDVTLRASESVDISGEVTKIFAGAEGTHLEPGEAPGDAGTLSIETTRLSLSDHAIISSDTKDGGGRGGDIVISGAGGEMAESVSVSEDGRIYSGAYLVYMDEGKTGDGGTVEIRAREVSFTHGGRISSESDGPGRGGDVTIRAESVRFSGTGSEGEMSKAYTSALNQEETAGDAGDILIEADHVVFDNEGGVTASTEGPGTAGVVRIDAGQVALGAGASVSSASEGGVNGGDAGVIDIHAESVITLDGNSSITTETAGDGKAGDITLTAADIRLNDNSSVTSASTSESDGAGDAGMILLDLTRSVIAESGSAVTTEAEGGGGGKIFIRAGGRIYLLDGEITSSVWQGWGNGGDITTASEHVVLNRSPVTANAIEGDGGAIFIVTENFLKSQDSKVTATSKRGNDGTVRIEAPDTDVSGALVVMPENLLDATRWMRTSCAARDAENVSRFVIRGRDAVPTAFDDWQPSPLTWSDELQDQDAEEPASGVGHLRLRRLDDEEKEDVLLKFRGLFKK